MMSQHSANTEQIFHYKYFEFQWKTKITYQSNCKDCEEIYIQMRKGNLETRGKKKLEISKNGYVEEPAVATQIDDDESR